MYHYHDDYYVEEHDEPCTDNCSADHDFAELSAASLAAHAACGDDAVAARSAEDAERSDKYVALSAEDIERSDDDASPSVGYRNADEVDEVAQSCCGDCATGRSGRRALHRLAEVRQMQHVTVREAQRRLGLSTDEIRQQEQPNYDLRLSELYAWQELLGVPVAELFADPGLNLSPPVQKRAEMVKLMKTAATLVEKARQPNVKALAERLVEQLLEVMPELKGVNPWPSVGVRRTKLELGRAALGIRLPHDTLSMLLSGE